MRVLITNAWINGRTGSELYASELAEQLLARGHSPVLYAPVLGALADRLRARTIPVVSHLADMTAPPDIIHGHHNRQIMTALMHFPGVPAVRFCHGWLDERPRQFPRIRRFVAVDDTVRDRLVSEWAIPAAQIEVILNAVDLARFQPRPALPPRPRRALIFSNGANAHLATLTRVCTAHGIALDAVGANVGHVLDAPEQVLGEYDLVFAKARCALEAMATGVAVIVCDEAGLGPLVTTSNFDRLRKLNFGIRTLSSAVTEDGISAELARYDAADAAEVSRLLRETGSLQTAVDTIVTLYEEVVAEMSRLPPTKVDDEFRAVAAYLRTLETEVTVKAQTYGLMRTLYDRAGQSAALRRLLPTRPSARRFAARLRRS